MELNFGGNSYASNQTVTRYIGPENPKLIFLSGVPYWDGRPFSEAATNLLADTARRAKINPGDFGFACVLGEIPPGRKHFALPADRSLHWQQVCCDDLVRRRPNVIAPVGDFALETLTNHTSVDKWQLSIIPATKLAQPIKTIPLIHPDRIWASYGDIAFLIFGMDRIREELAFPEIRTVDRTFHTAPTFGQAVEFLERAALAAELSVDIETLNGQISCVGFAPTPFEAMCIPALPENWSLDEFHHIWSKITQALEGPSRKVFQNYNYDCTYFSKYGIKTINLWHDTMLAQKFLHPELPMGLDTIARIYTREPYWKDEGKDWKNVKDLNQFWLYNCKDAAITLEAAHAQQTDLMSRKLDKTFYDYLMQMARPAAEMCWRGLPIDMGKRESVRASVNEDISRLGAELNSLAQPVLGKPLNSRSPKQVKDFFRAKGYRLPTKKGKETSDVTALLKLQQKYPKDESLALLITLSEKNKLASSYLNPLPYPDGRFRFSLNIHAADTGRWGCRKDPWDNGINAQTIGADFKKMFQAPPGFRFLEVDLKQADSRFVAWDAPEPTLIKFYTDGVDIHRFVAGRPEMFNKPDLKTVTKDERQLGKKVGHASNYGMRGNRLSEICLLEMGLVLPPVRADQMLEGYHRVFPGIRMWQAKIRSELHRSKRLTTPLGRERYFYSRLDEDLYRSAYAYRPQSTVTDVINRLILHVDQNRNPELTHHAIQTHDSALFLVAESYEEELKSIIRAEADWNPTLFLSGGELQIPIEAKSGDNWGSLQETPL